MAETHWKLLEEARNLGRSDQKRETLMAYCHLLFLYPEVAEAWAEYGGLLLSINEVEGALTAFSKCLALDPGSLPALIGVGRALLRSGQLEEAKFRLEQALSVDPQLTEVRLDLARCGWKQGNLDQALGVLAPVLAQEPDHPDLPDYLIAIYIRQENWPAVHREMLRRVDREYSGAEWEWEHFVVNMLFGAMSEGWAQHEARFGHPAIRTPMRSFPEPLWRGEPLENRTLLLHWEQGFGDTLMFVRYAPMVKRLGARVLLLAQPELAGLVATCPGVDEVVAEGGPLPPFDLHLPLLSLPHRFQTDLDSIPSQTPYLDVPACVPNRGGISECLAKGQDHVRIGIAWAGSPIHPRDSERSVPPETFRPLQALPNVSWHALQPGILELPPLPGLVSLAPFLSNFSDTAFALRGMDLVITVDSAMAHLAGALGIPTLLLVSYLPDWRWMMGRVDSPWYPTMRIYRQADPGDWGPVIERVLADLSSVG